MRSLDVYIDHRQVGTLSEGNDLWTFAYQTAWAQAPDGFDLSPALARTQALHVDGGTLRPVQWYFDNLLPEELLRQSIAKEAGLKGDDAFALLEYLGAESAGSLTLLPPGEAVPTTSDLRPLAYADLSKRIADLPTNTLARQAPKRMSLAGAQHKLLVVLKGTALFEPVGATPSTHILKPEHPQAATYPASVFNEYLTMKLAKAAGLNVPTVQMLYVPQPVYLIERFDRLVGKLAKGAPPSMPPPVQRLHIIDACQLLNKARTFKHTGASLDALREVIELARNKVQARLRLFRWLVFNIAVANDDCHLKNLSFHMGPDGVALAPHYDLLATGAYYSKAFAEEKATWSNVPMAIPLPGAKLFGEVTQDKLLAAAEALGLPQGIARRIVSEVTTQIQAAFQDLKAQHMKVLADAPPELAASMESEARFLRVLEHITLKDMLARLG